MSIKQSPEIVKEIIELPLSYVKYIFNLLRKKHNEHDQTNIKLHIAYLILSFPMTILVIQFLYYFSNGAINIKLLSAINIYSYATFLVLNIVWLSLNFTFLMSILLFLQKKMTIQSLKIVFLEPIKLYTIGSAFISLALYLSFNEMITNLRDIQDNDTFRNFMYEDIWKTILIIAMVSLILIATYQTVYRETYDRFRFWFGRFLSFCFAIGFLYITVLISSLSFKILPEFLKTSPESLIIKDEFCQQVVDGWIDRNPSCLENMDFKTYKMQINQCKKEKILGVD